MLFEFAKEQLNIIMLREKKTIRHAPGIEHWTSDFAFLKNISCMDGLVTYCFVIKTFVTNNYVPIVIGVYFVHASIWGFIIYN